MKLPYSLRFWSIFIVLNLFALINVNAQVKQAEKNIFFESNVYELSKEQQAEIIDFLDKPNIQNIQLFGFADTIGNLAANQKISEQRVSAVKDLILAWYGNVMIITKANGEKHHQEQQLANQRRVEIVVTYELDPPIKKDEKITPPLIIEDSIVIIPAQDISQREDFYETFATSDRIVIENLLFEPGTTDFLHDKTPNELFYLADLLRENPTMEIHIEGHVCCIDDKKLSKNRAQKVYSFLKDHGIKGNRMTYAGYSNSQPRVEELTPEDEKLNRRVEIVVTQR
ncbi:MAG: OmpA family protein [Flavobacteriales bacterium]|nr:OmpA family protein [Flavobacteriales bacterium]